MDERTMKKGAEAAKELAEHMERIATNVLTRETLDHLTRAATEVLKAVNSVIEDVDIPKDAKKHLVKAEKETLLAMRDCFDAVIQELDRMEKKKKEKPKELKKIDIEE